MSYQLRPQSAPDIQNNESPQTGIKIVQSSSSGSLGQKKNPNDFNFGKTLGEGSYGVVKLAVEKATGIEFAIKILDKAQMVKEHKTSWVNREKVILDLLRHPFVVNLFCTFQDATFLYFVTEYCSNGELLKQLKRVGSFAEDVAAFYTAEIVVALEYIHSMGVIHRDLKPENILLDRNNHIKLIDFGTAKQIGTERLTRSNSFCGTAEYVSPELLNDQTVGRGSDLWALGCIIYQFISGKPPFRAVNDYHIFQMIRKRELFFPDRFPLAAKDIIERLIVLDPNERIGNKRDGYIELKSHPFFAEINWENIANQTPPPFKAPSKPLEFPPETPFQKSTSEDNLTKLAQMQISSPSVDGETDRQKLLEQQKNSIWGQFLLPNSEVIIETGLVWKKAGLFSKKRQLVLTDLPRLFYVDPDKMVQKGEIPWSAKVVPELKTNKNFWVKTPNRTYYFEDLTGSAQKWVESINRVKSMKNST
eukprot:TRINITY_DN8162_c0_g1_i1.p1 TRINITY_DN8162_c0_g1~~TRINITY_DN8162_c0_g1_i1.p1  ORF type:complete len:476 (-),score=96.59 TRINITY_DN8162_c0_g1_i1:24-1451(-)